MDKPLGRDKLGRLIYCRDYVSVEGVASPLRVTGENRFGELDLRSEDYHLNVFVKPYQTTVDIEYGRYRNNYFRYFADLGSFFEVIDYMRACLCGDKDGLEFLEDFSKSFGVANFSSWLQQEATI